MSCTRERRALAGVPLGLFGEAVERVGDEVDAVGVALDELEAVEADDVAWPGPWRRPDGTLRRRSRSLAAVTPAMSARTQPSTVRPPPHDVPMGTVDTPRLRPPSVDRGSRCCAPASRCSRWWLASRSSPRVMTAVQLGAGQLSRRSEAEHHDAGRVDSSTGSSRSDSPSSRG